MRLDPPRMPYIGQGDSSSYASHSADTTSQHLLHIQLKHHTRTLTNDQSTEAIYNYLITSSVTRGEEHSSNRRSTDNHSTVGAISLCTITKNRADYASIIFQLPFTSSMSFNNIELPRTIGTIRHSNTEVLLSYPSVRRQSRETFTARVACLCWEFGSSSFPAVQLTLFQAGPRSADLQPLSRPPRTF